MWNTCECLQTPPTPPKCDVLKRVRSVVKLWYSGYLGVVTMFNHDAYEVTKEREGWSTEVSRNFSGVPSARELDNIVADATL